LRFTQGLEHAVISDIENLRLHPGISIYSLRQLDDAEAPV
jgi:hypothetical protein